MSRIELVAPCHFGLEAVLKKEIVDLGYEIVQVEDGKVIFAGDEAAVCRANIFLRTAERVLLKVGKFRAVTFDELFEKIKALPWENYIPSDGKFWVAKASSVKSKLFSPSDIQSIVKKAMVERLKGVYGLQWFPETGAEYPIRISFMKDEALVCLDTTGTLPSQERVPYYGEQSADQRDACSGSDSADTMEEGSDTGRPVLWKWYVSYRGSNDCSQYGAGHEPVIYRREVDEFSAKKRLV